MPSALGPVALRLWAYISGKSLVPMLQILHKTQNIPFFILISHLMYNKSFLLYMLSWRQVIFDCGFEIIEAKPAS